MSAETGASASDWWARSLAIAGFLGSLWTNACASRELERVKADLQRQGTIAEAQWQAKRQACVEALDVIDAYFTTQKWTIDGKDISVQGVEKVHIRRIRQVYNRLAVTVASPDVLTLYRKAFQLVSPGEKSPPIQADIIIDLRNAIRRELFGAAGIEDRRDMAWIARIDAACTDADPGCPNTEH